MGPPRVLPRGRPPPRPRPRPRPLPRVFSSVVPGSIFGGASLSLSLSWSWSWTPLSPIRWTLIVPLAAGLARLLIRAPRPLRPLVGIGVFVVVEGLAAPRSRDVVIWFRICERAASQSVVVGVLATRARRAVVLAERAGKVGGRKVEGLVVVEVEGWGADAGDVANAGAGAEGS